MSNKITILRKNVINNIPMFADEDSVNQNTWTRIVDIRCMDLDPGITARVYELENAPYYKNQVTSTYYNFSFDSAHQQVRPPYDINEGDYVAYNQGEVMHIWRIVKRETAQLFHNCCVYILTCNITNPKEFERTMGCGVTMVLTDEDIDRINKVISTPDEENQDGD